MDKAEIEQLEDTGDNGRASYVSTSILPWGWDSIRGLAIIVLFRQDMKVFYVIHHCESIHITIFSRKYEGSPLVPNKSL